MVLFYLTRIITKNIINYVPKKNFSRSTCLFGTGEKMRNILFIPVQKEKRKRLRRISIIGAAGVSGRTIAYNIIRNRYLCDELVLIDLPDRRVVLCGEALDFLHAGSLFGIPDIKIDVDHGRTADSDLIIVTSGIPRKPGQSRLDIVQTNIDIIKKTIPCLSKLSPECVFIVVANPADILAYATWKYSCFEKNRIIGAGTCIDSSRFRYYISKRLGINPYSVRANIIAEHGDSSVPVWSTVNVAGTRLRDIDINIGTCHDKNNWKQLYDCTRDAGGTLIKMKGYTNWSIGIVVAKIAEAVLTNAKTVHNVAVCAKGLYGIEWDGFMSFPAVLGNRGVYEIVQQSYDEDEISGIHDSVAKLEEVCNTIKF